MGRPKHDSGGNLELWANFCVKIGIDQNSRSHNLSIPAASPLRLLLLPSLPRLHRLFIQIAQNLSEIRRFGGIVAGTHLGGVEGDRRELSEIDLIWIN